MRGFGVIKEKMEGLGFSSYLDEIESNFFY